VRVAWDLDGTLVLTREANMAAYRRIGVEPPEDFHLRQWREWCEPRKHQEKGTHIAYYLRRLGRPTPLLGVFGQIGGRILTSASPPVVAALREQFPELRKAQIDSELDRAAKIRLLLRSSPGLYLDDSIETVEMVRRETPWRAAVVSF
jgi:hypothetical protein